MSEEILRYTQNDTENLAYSHSMVALGFGDMS